jgi:hypothetical protein
VVKMHVAIDAYAEGENFNLEVSLYFLAALFPTAKNVVGKGRQRKTVVNVSMHIMKNMLWAIFFVANLAKTVYIKPDEFTFFREFSSSNGYIY